MAGKRMCLGSGGKTREAGGALTGFEKWKSVPASRRKKGTNEQNVDSLRR